MPDLRMTAWYCTACGAGAEPTYPSLDPAHPFGSCQGKPRPCTRTVPLTADLDELADLQRRNRLAAARLRHRDHLGPHGKLIPSCTYCLAMIEQRDQAQAHA